MKIIYDGNCHLTLVADEPDDCSEQMMLCSIAEVFRLGGEINVITEELNEGWSFPAMPENVEMVPMIKKRGK